METIGKLRPLSGSLQSKMINLIIMYGGARKIVSLFHHVPHRGHALPALRNATEMSEQAGRC